MRTSYILLLQKVQVIKTFYVWDLVLSSMWVVQNGTSSWKWVTYFLYYRILSIQNIIHLQGFLFPLIILSNKLSKLPFNLWQKKSSFYQGHITHKQGSKCESITQANFILTNLKSRVSFIRKKIKKVILLILEKILAKKNC